MVIKPKEYKSVQCTILAILLVYTLMGIVVYPFLQLLNSALWKMCFLSFLLMLFLYIRRPMMTKFGIWTAAYLSVLFVVTSIYGNSIIDVMLLIVELTLLLTTFYNYKENIDISVKTCAITFSAMIYLNLFFMLAFPEWRFTAKDAFRGYLLGGSYNQMGGRILCGLITNVLCLKFGKKWLINNVILFIVSITTLFTVGSMTSLCGTILFLILCLIPTVRLKKVAMVITFVFYLLFQFIVVFGGEGLYNNSYVSYFVKYIIGKDMTFSGRTVIWEAAGHMFAESPIWGNGVKSGDWFLSNLSTLGRGTHNLIYSELLSGGIIILSILILLASTTLSKIMKYGIDNYSGRLILGIESWLVMTLFEAYPIFLLFYILLLAYYYPLLDKKVSALRNAHIP